MFAMEQCQTNQPQGVNMSKATSVKLNAEEIEIVREVLLDHIMTIEDNGNTGAAHYVPGLMSAYKKIEAHVK